MQKLLQTNKTIIYTGHEYVHFPLISMTVAQSKVEKCEELQVHTLQLFTHSQTAKWDLLNVLSRC